MTLISGAATKERVYRAALDAFVEKGYAGASLREIARRVGIEVASLYNHMSSKEELLFQILQQGNEAMLKVLDDALDSAPKDDPRERLLSVLKASTEFAATNSRYSIVAGRAELGALNPHRHELIMEQRAAIEDRFKIVVSECVEAGYLPKSVPVTVLAYFMMAPQTSVRGWYDEDGPLSAEAIADVAVELMKNGLKARR